MSREIAITTYENNTVYSVSVFDSYGIEHHLGYIDANEITKLKFKIEVSLLMHTKYGRMKQNLKRIYLEMLLKNVMNLIKKMVY